MRLPDLWAEIAQCDRAGKMHDACMVSLRRFSGCSAIAKTVVTPDEMWELGLAQDSTASSCRRTIDRRTFAFRNRDTLPQSKWNASSRRTSGRSETQFHSTRAVYTPCRFPRFVTALCSHRFLRLYEAQGARKPQPRQDCGSCSTAYWLAILK
jgi:hypothetical protein